MLVDKEKRGHSYATHRHPSLNDEKRAKIKEFTKNFAHKILKKLKEKGKLKKPANGSSSRSKSTSTPSGTPAGNSDADNSTVLATPNDTNEHNDLVNDIFGNVDDDEPNGSSSGHFVTPKSAKNGSANSDMAVDDGSLLDSGSLPFAPPSPPSRTHEVGRDRSGSLTSPNTPYGAIKVDSFRPGQLSSYPKTTPSRTPTSGGDPSPEF